MGKYLKVFDNHNGYTAYTADTENYLLPNVSYCIEQDECHFNPYNEPSQGLVLLTTYSVSSAEPTQLYFYNTDESEGMPIIRGVDMFDKIEIDGVEANIADIDSDEGTYNLGVGTHIVNFTLKDGVTSVPMGAFVHCTSLTSAAIPNGVISIEEAAFDSCSSLTNVVIPNSVTSIGNYTFAFCSSLTSITIPDSVTSIGENVFDSCTSLTDIVIPSGVTSVPTAAFLECTSLANITIPNGVISIGGGVFNSCSSLTSITIPDSVTSIGVCAFIECSMLSNVTCLATTPPTLDYSAFIRNASGRKIYVPSESVDAYKAAEGWSDYAADIEPITN